MIKRSEISVLKVLTIIVFFIFLLNSGKIYAEEKNGETSCRVIFLSPPSGIPSFLKELAPDSSEWIRMSVRYPHKRDHNKIYLENLFVAISEVFDPWFRNGSISDYEGILKIQHHIMAYGRSFNSVYRGVHELENIYPGVFRSEIKDISHLLTNFSLRISDDVDPSKLPEAVKNLIGLFRDSDVKSLAQIDPIIYRTPIPEIPEDSLPEIIITKNEFRAYFPPHYKIKIYLKRMKKVMKEIRKIPVSISERHKLLPLLAEYLQLGVCAHPFLRINFSMLMGQVNYILKFHGLRGISHKNLDCLALISDSKDFKKRFFMNVLVANLSRIQRK